MLRLENRGQQPLSPCFGDEAEEDEEAEEEAKVLVKSKSIYNVQKKSKASSVSKGGNVENGKDSAPVHAAPAGPAMNPNLPPKNDEESSSSSESSDEEDAANISGLSHGKTEDKVIFETREEREKREKAEQKEAKMQAKLDKIKAKEEEKKRKKKENPLLNQLHEQQQKYKKMHNNSNLKNRKKREQQTLALLGKFSDQGKERNLDRKFQARKRTGADAMVSEIPSEEPETPNEKEPEKSSEKASKSSKPSEPKRPKETLKDLAEYGFTLTEEQEMANKSSSEDEDFDIWKHKFNPSTNRELTTEAKKFNVSDRDAKDATMKKDENTYSINDPRNELNKRRRKTERQKTLGWDKGKAGAIQ